MTSNQNGFSTLWFVRVSFIKSSVWVLSFFSPAANKANSVLWFCFVGTVVENLQQRIMFNYIENNNERTRVKAESDQQGRQRVSAEGAEGETVNTIEFEDSGPSVCSVWYRITSSKTLYTYKTAVRLFAHRAIDIAVGSATVIVRVVSLMAGMTPWARG